MSVTTSTNYGYPIPGVTSNDRRIQDMQAVKAALVAIDADLANDKLSALQTSLLGSNNGIAQLDSTGKVPVAQLPSYIDDIVEGATLAEFPVTGVHNHIYIALDTNKPYRWSGTTYVYITSGAVDSVAGKTGVVSLVKADVGFVFVDNTPELNKPVSTAQTAAIAVVQARLDVTNAYNTGDETAATIKNKLGVTTLSGSNTGDQTLASLGIPNVENKSSATIRSELTGANVTTALGYSPVNPSILGTVNGIAQLDATGKVPATQLPSYVDDVIEGTTLAVFPTTG